MGKKAVLRVGEGDESERRVECGRKGPREWQKFRRNCLKILSS